MKGTEVIPTIQGCWIPGKYIFIIYLTYLKESAPNDGLSKQIIFTINTENSRSWCGGLNENVSHRLRCLKTESPVGGTAWGDLGVVALLEEMSLGWPLTVEDSHHF